MKIDAESNEDYLPDVSRMPESDIDLSETNETRMPESDFELNNTDDTSSDSLDVAIARTSSLKFDNKLDVNSSPITDQMLSDFFRAHLCVKKNDNSDDDTSSVLSYSTFKDMLTHPNDSYRSSTLNESSDTLTDDEEADPTYYPDKF